MGGPSQSAHQLLRTSTSHEGERPTSGISSNGYSSPRGPRIRNGYNTRYQRTRTGMGDQGVMLLSLDGTVS